MGVVDRKKAAPPPLDISSVKAQRGDPSSGLSEHLEKSVSFRSQLVSEATDLLGELDIHCGRTAKLVAALVSRLAAYTEEGRSLSPSIFICGSVEQLVKRGGPGEHISLSGALPTETAADKILKVAAPLCSGGWQIYVERSSTGETCQFGVFFGSSDPSASVIDETVLEDPDNTFPVIKVSQSITNKVEVRNSRGSAIQFRFNDDIDITLPNSRADVADISESATSDIEPPDAGFTSFIARVLVRAVESSHGTLIVVVNGDIDLPDGFRDFVKLGQPLDLHSRYLLHRAENRSADSVSRLQAAADLLQGFLNSDGITILSTKGQVLGYRAFIKVADADDPADGGARTRAYQALQALVSAEIPGAFFRSQDGRMSTAIHKKDGADG